MSSVNVSNYKIKSLNKNNYDTWEIQTKAVLVGSGLWGYVSGETPISVEEADKKKWQEYDSNASSDLILIISPNELKQVKNCDTSKALWDKLKSVYQRRGPACKPTLLKRLFMHKMKDNDDMSTHLHEFTDAVDKFQDMSIEINSDLLSIMMVYS